MSLLRRLSPGGIRSGTGTVTNLTVIAGFDGPAPVTPPCDNAQTGYSLLLGGSRSPTSISGKNISAFFSTEEWEQDSIDSCSNIGTSTSFSFNGLASDPGQSYLTSIIVTNSSFTSTIATILGSSASYVYFSGVATWTWSGELLMYGAGTYYFKITTTS